MNVEFSALFCFFGLFSVNLAYARWPAVDPHAENYYSQSPYAFTGNNPVNFVDPDGRDWYSYRENYTDENGKEQARTRYEYREQRMSDREMQENDYTHLGYTHADDDLYYSLLGEVKNSSTDEGKLYAAIDRAIINAYTVQSSDPWSCEPAYEPTTDFFGIKNYRENVFGSGNNLYKYPSSYAGTDMYFNVYKTTMEGRYVPPTEHRYGSPNYMGVKLPAAYYAYIRVAGSSNNNIIYLPFSNKAHLSAFQGKINNLFR